MIQTTTFSDHKHALSVEIAIDASTHITELTLNVNDVPHFVTAEQLICLSGILNEMKAEGYLKPEKERVSTAV